MERIVNDLIELVNLQSGRVQMVRHNFEARDLVSWAVENSREGLERKNQVIEWVFPDELLYVHADFGRMGQVLKHLISNASKFSAPGKTINLMISTLNNEKGARKNVIFCVQDEGVGIAESERGLIFEKFYQSQISENANETGVGLGLPLAKTLVELNGGRLWFESEPGKGSSFFFSLPLTSPHSGTPNNHL
jgi:signal transduction histidine kinase